MKDRILLEAQQVKCSSVRKRGFRSISSVAPLVGNLLSFRLEDSSRDPLSGFLLSKRNLSPRQSKERAAYNLNPKPLNPKS